MAYKQPIYKAVYDVYEFNNETDNFRRNIRDVVSKAFKKLYNDKEWEELNSFEKDRFIYVQIRTKMIEKLDASKHSRINKKIDEYIDKNLLQADIAIHEHNSVISQAYEIFYCSSDSIDKMQENYKKFCDVLNLYNSRVPAPSMEEWKQRNEIFPMRVYDYCQSYYDEKQEKYEEVATQSEIDHIILQTMLKVLEEKENIKIDIESIDEVITYLKNYHIEEDDILFSEDDSPSYVSKEEREMLIKNDQKYMNYKMKLDNLDFVIKN